MSDHSHSATVSSMTLNGMRSSQDHVWQRVLSRFTPRVSAWLLSSGVAKADIPDQVQEVWRSVLASLRHFERNNETHSFGGWLHTITNRRANDYLQQKKLDKAIIKMLIEEASRQSIIRKNGEEIYVSNRLSQLKRACQQVRSVVNDSTWQTFEMYVIENKAVEDVIAALNIPEHSVYTAKSRVLRRLRALLAETETNHDQPGIWPTDT
ncbi:MAG: sigma-70 family RNA polymerase sigma factor [bacterium]